MGSGRAADGNVYSPSNDSSGFKDSSNCNLHLNKIVGDNPAKLDGVTVNPMLDYRAGASLKDDGYTWKSSGFAAVNDVFY